MPSQWEMLCRTASAKRGRTMIKHGSTQLVELTVVCELVLEGQEDTRVARNYTRKGETRCGKDRRGPFVSGQSNPFIDNGGTLECCAVPAAKGSNKTRRRPRNRLC